MSYGNPYGNNPYGGSNPYQQGPSAEGGYGYDQVRRNPAIPNSIFNSIRLKSKPISEADVETDR